MRAATRLQVSRRSLRNAINSERYRVFYIFWWIKDRLCSAGDNKSELRYGWKFQELSKLMYFCAARLSFSLQVSNITPAYYIVSLYRLLSIII